MSGAGADAESVIKVKKASTKQIMTASEAEALRKDPLKNYGSGATSTFEDG